MLYSDCLMPFTWQSANEQKRWRDWMTGGWLMLARADSDIITLVKMFRFFLWKPKCMYRLFATQLQGLVGELREGLHAALAELSELRQRDTSLEDKLQTHLTDVDDKIMGLKNSLNTFKVVNSKHKHFLNVNMIWSIWLGLCWSWNKLYQ